MTLIKRFEEVFNSKNVTIKFQEFEILEYFRIFKVGPTDNTLQLSTVNITEARLGNMFRA